MLSLKKTIDGLDREQQRFETVRGCLLETLNGVQEHAVEVTAELAQEFRLKIRTLHRELCSNGELSLIEQGGTEAVAALADYKRRSEEALLRTEDDLRGIMDVLGTAAEALGGHNEKHSVRLKEFAAQLHLVSRGTDLARMRIELGKRVEALRATADAMFQDNQASLSHMQGKLEEFQKRLERAESQASIDGLTGLLNRGAGETKLRDAIDIGRPVSVILIDLNGFKQINDRWGHSAGDQVLKTFARTLSQNVRPVDAVCRWGGDEFLIMLNGNEEVARKRTDQLRGKLRTTHTLVVLGKMVAVEVGASLGVAQARAGEPMEDLLTRADIELYGSKQPARLPAVLS